MNIEHEEWCLNWLVAHGAAESGGYGLCREAAEDMAKAFPALKVVRGHVHCLWGKRGHWWCVDPEGNIVDPTVGQFPWVESYEEFHEGDEYRIGKCMNCGEEIWGSSPEAVHSTMFCGQACESAMAHYLGV